VVWLTLTNKLVLQGLNN